MKIYEIPVPSMEFFRRVREGGPFCNPLGDVESVILHQDDSCVRAMTFNSYAPETTAFLRELQINQIKIVICKCLEELNVKTNWGYTFD